VGTEAREATQECCPDGCEGMGGGNPSESESSRDDEEEEDEDKEEGEITSPPHSPPLEDLPSLGDLFSQQAGISIGAHRTKHPQTDTEGSSSP
jgi:hypothetical protein